MRERDDIRSRIGLDDTISAKAYAEAENAANYALTLHEIAAQRVKMAAHRATVADADGELGEALAYLLAEALCLDSVASTKTEPGEVKPTALPALFVIVKAASHQAGGFVSGAVWLVLHGRSTMERLDAYAIGAASRRPVASCRDAGPRTRP